MRIQITRRGGLAGVVLRAEIETSDMEAESARRVETTVPNVLREGATARTPHPDAFEYEISVPGEGVVKLGEHQIPGDLEPLLVELARVGRIESSRSSR
jgi:Emfourin